MLRIKGVFEAGNCVISAVQVTRGDRVEISNPY